MEMIRAILAGAIMVSAWAISVFFWRFRRKTGEWLFGYFAIAFLLLGVERISIVLVSAEFHMFVYLIRLSAFLILIFGILDKNRRGHSS